jgi:hypothetical protein
MEGAVVVDDAGVEDRPVAGHRARLDNRNVAHAPHGNGGRIGTVLLGSAHQSVACAFGGDCDESLSGRSDGEGVEDLALVETRLMAVTVTVLD